MEQLDLVKIKTIQLDILKVFDRFCKENNLRYSLTYGSLLGAVRHKGFIPWDDDIDIMMPRPDYDNMLNIFNEYTDYYKVKAPTLNPDHPYVFAKIEDTRTQFIENIEINYEIGINIDVFPVDGVPSNNLIFRIYFKWIKLLRYLLLTKLITIDFNNRSNSKNILLSVLKFILRPIRYQYLIDIIRKKIVKYDYNKSDYAMMPCINLKPTERMDKMLFENYKKLQFENYPFTAIEDFHRYLQVLYGDYMKLPPLDQQITHHAYKAFYKEK
jgi:lipopolysaccharide cholinephosphotransferase